MSGTEWSSQGEFAFSFWASLHADGAATPLAYRAALLAATNRICDQLRLFGLLMHVGSESKKSKMEAIYCPAQDEEYGDGDTPDLVLDCDGIICFTKSFVYLGSLLHRGPSDHHDAEARIKKAPMAFGALRDRLFGSRDVPGRLKGKVYGVVYSRYCSTAATPGVSQRRLSRDSVPGTTSESERCAALAFARRRSIASLPRACSSAQGRSSSSTTSRAKRSSERGAMCACPRAAFSSGFCCLGRRHRASPAARI